MFKFEKLEIWNRSMDLGEEANAMISSYPAHEKYNLTSQTLRSVDSIALNISEGSISQSNKQQRKFISYSIGSLAEFVSCVHKSKRRKYISTEQFSIIYVECEILMKKLISFRNSIPKKNSN